MSGTTTKFFVLCQDTDMTLRSQPWPTGEAVSSEGAALAWVSEQPDCRQYYEVTVADDAGAPGKGGLLRILAGRGGDATSGADDHPPASSEQPSAAENSSTDTPDEKVMEVLEEAMMQRNGARHCAHVLAHAWENERPPAPWAQTLALTWSGYGAVRRTE